MVIHENGIRKKTELWFIVLIIKECGIKGSNFNFYCEQTNLCKKCVQYMKKEFSHHKYPKSVLISISLFKTNFSNAFCFKNSFPRTILYLIDIVCLNFQRHAKTLHIFWVENKLVETHEPEIVGSTHTSERNAAAKGQLSWLPPHLREYLSSCVFRETKSWEFS